MFLKFLIGNACILLVFILLVHHKMKHGRWFDWSNLASHEFIEGLLFGIIIGLFFG